MIWCCALGSRWTWVIGGSFLLLGALPWVLQKKLAWTQTLSEGIYIGTGIAIIWYTVETSRLRREAQLQTELQTRPFLSVRKVGSANSVRFFVTNIGKGMARNIAIADVTFDTSLGMKALPITHLAPGEEGLPTWRMWAAPLPGDTPGEVPGEEHVTIANRALEVQETTLVFTYASMVGQQYQTAVKISRGEVEIIDDRRGAT